MRPLSQGTSAVLGGRRWSAELRPGTVNGGGVVQDDAAHDVPLRLCGWLLVISTGYRNVDMRLDTNSGRHLVEETGSAAA
jgi:hypothetical protein